MMHLSSVCVRAIKYKNKKHNMVVFYNIWKKFNEIQLTKIIWTWTIEKWKILFIYWLWMCFQDIVQSLYCITGVITFECVNRFIRWCPTSVLRLMLDCSHQQESNALETSQYPLNQRRTCALEGPATRPLAQKCNGTTKKHRSINLNES